ncbi:MAG: zinc ribbon domain-containing protein [Chloroflexi bacterium]|nr:zinc ribbon domain-containing protein [Chloroflexota bacterium]
MPIYEYYCNDCHKRISIFVRNVNDEVKPLCSKCNTSNVTKLVSKVAYHKSESTRLEESGEPARFNPIDTYKDPRDIGRYTENKLKEMGMDMNSEEHKDTFANLRKKIDQARDGDLSFIDKKDD